MCLILDQENVHGGSIYLFIYLIRDMNPSIGATETILKSEPTQLESQNQT